jgi:hypothetical protein
MSPRKLCEVLVILGVGGPPRWWVEGKTTVLWRGVATLRDVAGKGRGRDQGVRD